MDKLLAMLVSTWDVVAHIATWALNNPGAAAFWGAFSLTVLNYVVKLTPWRGDDGLVDILTQAVASGYAKAKAKA